MPPADRDKMVRIVRQKVTRARELLVLADLAGITIGHETDGSTSFTPMNACPPRLIEEGTLLAREIKAIQDGRVTFDDKAGTFTIKQ